MKAAVLPSWKLSGVGILANNAFGPRALLANIPTPLNIQLGNTDTILRLPTLLIKNCPDCAPSILQIPPLEQV